MRLSLIGCLLFMLAGCGTPSFLVTPVSNTNRLEEIQAQSGSGAFPKKIAVIELEGMIVNARSGGFLQPTENMLSLFIQELDTAAKDPAVKAVVLRVNSPGGTVTASDTIYQQVIRFREQTHKPVIAATQEVAASGAYYICCAADKIVAHPTSVVGSIGVIFNTFDVEQTMAKVGVHSEAIKSGPLKDMGSPFRAMRPNERAVMQQMVDEYFHRFQTVVSTHRPIKEPPPATPLPADYEGIYSGRVFSGQKAVELGLADQTGLLEDAIDLAKKSANTPDAKVILYKRPYGYGGSIYASATTPTPRSDVLHLEIPGARSLLPTGFYYLWQPGEN